MNMKKIANLLCLIALFYFGFVGPLAAQEVVASWNFNLTAQKGAVNANNKAEGLQFAKLIRGPGIRYSNSSTLSYVALFNTADKTEEDALRSNSYFQVEITPQANNKITLITLKARLRTSGSESVKAYRWYYSVDGAKYHPIGNEATTIALTHKQGENQKPIALSGIAELSNVKGPVYLRLYAWGTENSDALVNLGFGFGKGNAVENGRNILEILGTIN